MKSIVLPVGSQLHTKNLQKEIEGSDKMRRQHLFHIIIPLVVNILLSWTLLPFVIPPFGGYSLSALFEVLLWQCIGMVAWPITLLGIAVSLPFGAELTRVVPLLFVFLYPAILFFLIRTMISKTIRRVDFILLHLCVFFSFVIVWYSVLHGYDFMVG